MKLIMVVENAFWIGGRGLVVVGQMEDGVTITAGDAVVVVKPDSTTEYESVITGIDMMNRAFPSKTVAFNLRDLKLGNAWAGDRIFKLEDVILPGEPPEEFEGIEWIEDGEAEVCEVVAVFDDDG